VPQAAPPASKTAEPPKPEPPRPAEPAKPAASGDPLGGLGFDLTLEPVAEGGPAAAADRADESFGMDGLGAGAPSAEPERAPAEPAPKADQKKAESFDFTGFGGMLTEDEDDEEEAEEQPPPPPPDSGLAIEGVLASSYGNVPEQPAAVAGGGLDLEQPLSDLPIDQAGWSPKDRMKIETAEDEAGGGESGAERARAVDERSGRPDRAARARPAAPPPAEKRSPLPALVAAIVILAVVGGGGWFGWTKLKEREAAAPVETAPVDPPVPIPAIAAELEPRMRELADSTMADFLAALRTTLPAEAGVPAEPVREWLSGSYLADATQYASIGQYWQAMGAFVDDLEQSDAEIFASLYRIRLDSASARPDSAGVAAEDAQSMLDRAVAGFMAGRPDRRPFYAQLRAVVEASLGLHESLVTNEARIEYDPAAGGASRDPVLEAVPATPELGKEMWDRVDGITQSLDALGALDLVTTDRLLGVFGTKLATVPLR
jgi:hypothetical protein